jgi:hypothetical protein
MWRGGRGVKIDILCFGLSVSGKSTPGSQLGLETIFSRMIDFVSFSSPSKDSGSSARSPHRATILENLIPFVGTLWSIPLSLLSWKERFLFAVMPH